MKFAGDDFLSQVLSEPTRKDALLDLLFVNREGLVEDVMVGGCLGHSDHKMVEFKVFSVMRKRTAELLPWISKEKTISCSGSYLAVSPGNLLFRA